MKKIGYLGAGAWGFALAVLLANKGHEVTLWARSPDLAASLKKNRTHPNLEGALAPEVLRVTSEDAE